jgi:hypothetical protein
MIDPAGEDPSVTALEKTAGRLASRKDSTTVQIVLPLWFIHIWRRSILFLFCALQSWRYEVPEDLGGGFNGVTTCSVMLEK